MSVTFYAQSRQDGAFSACLSLPAALADHLLFALDYELRDWTQPYELLAADVLGRIAAVARQFAVGHGAEFTSNEMNEADLLSNVQRLESVAQRAIIWGGGIRLFKV
jgi:hypothetical protein